MTWKPSHGLWSTENFDSIVGFSGTNLSVQTVTGGYAGLVPQIDRSVSYLHPWAPLSGWQVNNSLNTRTVIEADFMVTGGRVNSTDTASGAQTSLGAGSMWHISTPALTPGPSGQTFEYVALESGSPFQGFYSRMKNSSDALVVEFDVASHHRIDYGPNNPSLIGITGNTLTGLPALTGKINHGLYISNGPNWDFIECTPDGVRSLNHPELSIFVKLSQANRFRVGVRNNDIFILHEDGYGVAGLGQFDTANAVSGSPHPILAFGAPWTGYNFSFPNQSTGYGGVQGVQGFEGSSYWDNFKVLMGDFALDTPDKYENSYTTQTTSLYTPVFDAGVSLRKWSSASVKYQPKNGGVTTIEPQYLTATDGDATGWLSVPSAKITLEDGRDRMRIELGDVPASVPSQRTLPDANDHSIQSTASKIRFLIKQHSIHGQGPAPLVDSITVQGFKNESFLETVPDWKPVDREADISLYIRPDKFRKHRMEPKAHSTFFFRSPSVTGAYSGTFSSIDVSGHVGTIHGTGQIVAGPFDTAFQNYWSTTGFAQTGTPAGNLFGTKSLTNFAPDPQFDIPFRDVSALTGNTTANTVGKVGKFVELPSAWTGQVPMEFIQHPVHRLGGSVSDPDFAQKVKVLSTPYDNTCGFEIAIPSGLTETGKKGIFEFSLKTEAEVGVTPPNIVVYATGDIQAGEQYFSGTLFTGAYRRVSIPVNFHGTGTSRLGIVATGTRGAFIVDDLQLLPISTSYLECHDVHFTRHPFGVIGSDYSFYTENAPANPYRAATVASCDLYLYQHPTGENILLQKMRTGDRTNQKGFVISINSDGFPVCLYDVCHGAKGVSGYSGSYESFTGSSHYGSPTGETFVESKAITGEAIVPLGRWTNIGFIHQSHAFRRYGARATSGQSGLGSFAASNRAFLTIDGLPVASQDTMTGWIHDVISGYTGHGEDGADEAAAIPQANPLPTYVCDGKGSVVVASGIYCKIDNVSISRPPSADVESSLYIDAARVGYPYFTPDVMLKPGGVDQDYTKNNAISNTTTSDPDSPGFYTQSIWNLDNPGPYTNWDHGANRNHLLFYGDVSKESDNSPYGNDFGSTKFRSGSYAKAPYSSTLHRLFHSRSGHWGTVPSSSPRTYLIEPLYPERGRIIAGGWINIQNTGNFWELAEDERMPDGNSLALCIFNGTGVRLWKRNTSGSPEWAHTGYLTGGGNFSGEWHHVGFDLTWSGAVTGASQPVSGFLVIDGLSTGIGLNDSTTGFYGSGYAPEYEGAVDGTGSSALFLGRDIDCNLADFFLDVNPKDFVDSPVMWDVVASKTADKGGIYNQVYYDGGQFTGKVAYNSYFKGVVTLPISDRVKETTLWAGSNEYATDEGENLEGFALFPSTSFSEAENYSFRYDDSAVSQVFGSTDSPIRIGFNVPRHAINLARIDSPSYTVQGAITTIDLSDSNPSNLSTFRGGQFSLTKSRTEHFGRLEERTINGGFERANEDLAGGPTGFYDLSKTHVQARMFDFSSLQYEGWTMNGSSGSVTQGPDSCYDIVPGCFAGTGAGGIGLDSKTPITGGFYVSPLNGFHALGMHQATGLNSTGVVAIHTNLQLTGGKDHLFTISARQPYYPGNTTNNLCATVIAVSGNLSIPVGEGIVAYWHPTSGHWIAGAPNGYAINGTGGLAMAPNISPNDTSVTKTSFIFNTNGGPGVSPGFCLPFTGFPHEGPTQYGLWISLTGSVSQQSAGSETETDFIVVDEARIYEIVDSKASGLFRGTNTGDYSGQFDMVFKDQVDTDDLRVTSLSVADQDLDAPAEAYYAYLLGRGDYAVSIPDALPHARSGSLSTDTRSGLVNNYISNIDTIKKRIDIRGFDGKPVPNFQWDIVTSPYSYRDLLDAVDNNQTIHADGITPVNYDSGQYSGYLPDGLFSVVMVSPSLPNNGTTIFVHYPSENLDTNVFTPTHREIYNPIPVMREKLSFETPTAGQFSVELSPENQKFFDLTVYGINSGYSGNF